MSIAYEAVIGKMRQYIFGSEPPVLHKAQAVLIAYCYRRLRSSSTQTLLHGAHTTYSHSMRHSLKSTCMSDLGRKGEARKDHTCTTTSTSMGGTWCSVMQRTPQEAHQLGGRMMAGTVWVARQPSPASLQGFQMLLRLYTTASCLQLALTATHFSTGATGWR